MQKSGSIIVTDLVNTECYNCTFYYSWQQYIMGERVSYNENQNAELVYHIKSRSGQKC